MTRYWVILSACVIGCFFGSVLLHSVLQPVLGGFIANSVAYGFIAFNTLACCWQARDGDLKGAASAWFGVWLINSVIVATDQPIGASIILGVCATILYAGYKQIALSLLSLFTLLILLLFHYGAIAYGAAVIVIALSWLAQSIVLFGQSLSIFMGVERYRIPIPSWLYYGVTGIDVSREVQEMRREERGA